MMQEDSQRHLLATENDASSNCRSNKGHNSSHGNYRGNNLNRGSNNSNTNINDNFHRGQSFGFSQNRGNNFGHCDNQAGNSSHIILEPLYVNYVLLHVMLPLLVVESPSRSTV